MYMILWGVHHSVRNLEARGQSDVIQILGSRFNSADAAKEAADKISPKIDEWRHIVNPHTGKIAWRWERGAWYSASEWEATEPAPT
jgi:hypothetical protein